MVDAIVILQPVKTAVEAVRSENINLYINSQFAHLRIKIMRTNYSDIFHYYHVLNILMEVENYIQMGHPLIEQNVIVL